MTYTMKRGLESPTIKADQEEARQFLESAISTLIIKAISPDGTIPGDVQMELLNNVKQYETENKLDQSQSAEKRAANIVDRESDMLDEASKWATGAAQASLDEAYDGASLYQWVNQAFNQLQNKYNTSRNLKGIVSTGMVSSFGLCGLLIIDMMLNTCRLLLEYIRLPKSWSAWSMTGMKCRMAIDRSQF